MMMWCLWYLKDFYLKAIPNGWSSGTTLNQMFVISQRLLFESNSQHAIQTLTTLERCLWYLKDFYLKAIPNNIMIVESDYRDVCDISKTFIWKQFPTTDERHFVIREMFVISQILLFESNSQQEGAQGIETKRCLWYSKTSIRKQFSTVVPPSNFQNAFDIAKIQQSLETAKQFHDFRIILMIIDTYSHTQYSALQVLVGGILWN